MIVTWRECLPVFSAADRGLQACCCTQPPLTVSIQPPWLTGEEIGWELADRLGNVAKLGMDAELKSRLRVASIIAGQGWEEEWYMQVGCREVTWS